MDGDSSASQLTRRVAVIGAGAAGTMAAIHSAKAGAETTLFERTKDGGRKILISGGGRCNILPAKVDESRFVTDSSRNTLNKILRSWPLEQQKDFFESELGLVLEEEVETRKLFPSTHRARDVRDGLQSVARRYGARLRFDTYVTDLRPLESGKWEVVLDSGYAEEFDRVIIATGGLSVPNTGSDGTGLKILEKLGHTLHPLYAALTPVVCSPAVFGDLSGVSLKVSISASGNGRAATGKGGFLFTHHGYSGPSVLDVSYVISRDPRINGKGSSEMLISWTPLEPSDWEYLFLQKGSRSVLGIVRLHLPERLADRIIELSGVDPMTRLAEFRKSDRETLIRNLTAFPLPWTKDDGYRKAEVTGGGVPLSEIVTKSMESRIKPNLYICGEALDAFGPIGGYNFYWSWITGRLAGEAAAK